MRHLYYYVPPCPKCGSRKTGRYVKRPLSGVGFMREESLKNGELIRFASAEPLNNAFCANCGHEWGAKVEVKFWKYDQIHAEMLARGTEPMYQSILEQKGEEEAGRWNIGRRMRESYMSSFEEKEPKEEYELEPEFIDSRKRDTIELLYLDEELIEKVREAQSDNVY